MEGRVGSGIYASGGWEFGWNYYKKNAAVSCRVGCAPSSANEPVYCVSCSTYETRSHDARSDVAEDKISNGFEEKLEKCGKSKVTVSPRRMSLL